MVIYYTFIQELYVKYLIKVLKRSKCHKKPRKNNSRLVMQKIILYFKNVNWHILFSCIFLLVTTCFRSLQNQTSCIRNMLSGTGSCVEKSVEVALAIATSFENFLLTLHHRFTCEGALPGKFLGRFPKMILKIIEF